MFGIILILHVAASLLIIFFVLLQSGRGAELGAAFGSAGQANSIRGQMSGIGKITTAVAIIFMLTSLTLAFLSSEAAKESVVSTLEEVPVIPGTESPKNAAEQESSSIELKLDEEEEEKPSDLLEQKKAPPVQSSE